MRGLLKIIAIAVVFFCFADNLYAEGWISPTANASVSQNGSTWSNLAYAYDNPNQPNLNYAQCSYTRNRTGAIAYLYRTTAFNCGYIRINTDFDTTYIASVNVAVGTYSGGTFTQYLNLGSFTTFNNGIYQELPFTPGTINAIRFSYTFKNRDWTPWLYEVGFYESPTTIDPPTITTLDATSVQANSANIHGHIVDNGGEPCSTWFEWYDSADSATIYTTTQQNGYLNDQTFGYHLSGLTTGHTYYFRAAAKNTHNATTSYGNWVVFTAQTISLSGWVSPNGASGTGWSDFAFSYDDEGLSGTSYYHPSGDSVTVGPLYLTQTTALTVDKIRFQAKKTAEISSITVDVNCGGGSTYTNVYSGTYNDSSWGTVWNESSDISSCAGVTSARVYFTLSDAAYGLVLTLYEFDFHVNTTGSPGGGKEYSSAFIDGTFAGAKK